MASPLQNFLAYIDNPTNQTNFKNRLHTAVRYQRFVVHQLHHGCYGNFIVNINISSDPTLHQEVKAVGTWLENCLRDCGVDTKQVDLNKIVHPSNC